MRVQPYQSDQAQVSHYGDHVETEKQEEEGQAESWLICQACKDELWQGGILSCHPQDLLLRQKQEKGVIVGGDREHCCPPCHLLGSRELHKHRF